LSLKKAGISSPGCAEQLRSIFEELPEGNYLATSDEIQGLVAQGRTISETLEIARDVARRLLEAQAERQQRSEPKALKKIIRYATCGRLLTWVVCPDIVIGMLLGKIASLVSLSTDKPPTVMKSGSTRRQIAIRLSQTTPGICRKENCGPFTAGGDLSRGVPDKPIC
ncbi:MAG: hypothetical protein RQ723_10610, partial [Desulfuromonadales bacterium]|nr:hypothetical protein [Desulfuromonadales bacterium]